MSSLPGSTLTITAPTDGSNDGKHAVWCRATDPTGQSDQVSGTVRIDTTPPVTDLSGTDASGKEWVPGDGNWHKSPVTLKLKPSDPPGRAGVETSGVDHYDYLIAPPAAMDADRADAGVAVTDIVVVANLAGDRTTPGPRRGRRH